MRGTLRLRRQQPLLVAIAALLMALLLSLLPFLPLHAQDGQARLLADPEAVGALTVGDVATITLEVSHPADTVAILPAWSETWGDLEVRHVAAPEVSADEAGGQLTRQVVQVALFAPGDFMTPALHVLIADRTGQSTDVIAPPIALTVSSVLDEPEPPLRDLKAQADARAPILWQVGGGVSVAGVTVLLLFWLQRRGSLPALPALAARTPMERSLGELEKLAAAGLLQKGHYGQFCQSLSLTVRRHLQREYGLDVEERTTRELRGQVRRLALPADTSRRLLALLAEADLVKFADAKPTLEGAVALLTEARAVVKAISAARRQPPVAIHRQARAGARP